MSESGGVQFRSVKNESSKKRTKREGGEEFPVSIGGRKLLTYLRGLVAGFRNFHDDKVQLEAASKLWDLISMPGSALIRIVTNSGVVPDVILSMGSNSSELDYLAAGIVNNIAAGTSEHTKLLIDHSAIPLLVMQMTAHDHRTRVEAVTALGNIAADFPSCRDLVFRDSFLDNLRAQVNEHSVQNFGLSTHRAATWTFANMFKGNPQLDLQWVEAAIPDLLRLFHSNDEEVFENACRALSYLVEYADKLKDNIVQESILRQLVQLLLHPHPSVLNHALCAVSNITVYASRDSNHKIECIIRAGLLACLGSVLANNHQKTMKKEVCRIIIDISHRGCSTQVTIEGDLIHATVSLLHTSDLEMKKVAIETIIAVSKMCNNDQLRSLVNDCRKPLLKLLGCKDPDIVALCLEMLQFFDGEFGFIGRDYGVAQQLIELLAHKNPSICKSARSLLTSLGYTIGDDSDDELLDPSISFEDLQVPAEGFRFV